MFLHKYRVQSCLGFDLSHSLFSFHVNANVCTICYPPFLIHVFYEFYAYSQNEGHYASANIMQKTEAYV